MTGAYGGLQLLAAICVIAAAFAAAYMWDHGIVDDDPLATPLAGTDQDSELCPMGCGQTTEDPAGGPCHDCWNRIERTQP